jgi:hypothetical protein
MKRQDPYWQKCGIDLSYRSLRLLDEAVANEVSLLERSMGTDVFLSFTACFLLLGQASLFPVVQ